MKIRALQQFPDGSVITRSNEGQKAFASMDEALAYMETHGETVWQIGYLEDLATVYKKNQKHLNSGKQDENWKPQGMRE